MTKLKQCCFGLLLFAGISMADDSRPLIIGVEDSQYYPHYAVQDGNWIGFGYALLQAFGQSSGYQFEYRPMPIERLFRSFLSGEVDFKYPDNPEWRKDLKKNTRITYSAPVVSYIDGVSVRAESLGLGVESVSVLGTLRGFTPVSWLERVEKGQVSILENDSFEGLVRQALIGRVDGVYANVDVVQHKLMEITGSANKLAFDKDLPHSEAHYRLSSIENHRIIDEFNKWMSENHTLIQDLELEYFGGSR